MSTKKPCKTVSLAGNGFARVESCSDCGCVSVHVGVLTFRLDEDALESLLGVLGEAVARLQAERPNGTRTSYAELSGVGTRH